MSLMGFEPEIRIFETSKTLFIVMVIVFEHILYHTRLTLWNKSPSEVKGRNKNRSRNKSSQSRWTDAWIETEPLPTVLRRMRWATTPWTDPPLSVCLPYEIYNNFWKLNGRLVSAMPGDCLNCLQLKMELRSIQHSRNYFKNTFNFTSSEQHHEGWHQWR